MKKVYSSWVKFTPIQILVIGYFVVTLIFTLLLMLPISSVKNTCQPFVDALFMASSGISTTGLTVVDIGSYYSLLGQIILMLDFQIGGIGYMAFFVFIFYMFKARTSMRNQLIATESMAGTNVGYNFRFFRKVILFTFLFEFAGGVALFFHWLPDNSFIHAIYLGFFHSISAFCTAGFCLFPDSLMSYKNDMFVNLVIIVVSLAGGIGFYVLTEIYMMHKKAIKGEMRQPLSVHSRLAIIMTVIVVAAGTAIILIAEKWAPLVSFKERLMISLFQAVSASTTDGYNTIDIGTMAPTSLFAIILLMFVGASPGSTGGGIKTTTAGVVCLSTAATLTRKKDATFFKRMISSDTIRKSFAILLLFAIVAIIDVLILTVTEKTDFLRILFEIISALGNTGLSTGITGNLSSLGKVLLSITMFIGRVGPLTIGVAFIGKPAFAYFRYPIGDIFVG